LKLFELKSKTVVAKRQQKWSAKWVNRINLLVAAVIRIKPL